MSRLARGRPARSALPDKSGVPSRITRLEAARFRADAGFYPP